MMRRFSYVLAAVLLAAALAGCTGGEGSRGASSAAMSGSGAGEPSPTPSTTPDSAALSGADSAAGTGEANNTAYSAEGLKTVLDGFVGYGADSAGGSLKTATAAGELVNFAAAAGDASATLGADTKAWLDTLTDDQKEALRANWAGVRDMANSIVTDLDGQSGILADAGVSYDFAHMDMGGVPAFVNTVDSVLGAY